MSCSMRLLPPSGAAALPRSLRQASSARGSGAVGRSIAKSSPINSLSVVCKATKTPAKASPAGTTVASRLAPEVSPADRKYNMPLLSFPLKPTKQRATVFKEVVPGRIYTLEQEQTFADICTNIRCTIVVLESGGLWVHAPIAPTNECIAYIQALGREVEYIVLSTFAIEHKIFVGPFARKFPQAEVWVAPQQWMFPINLPLQLIGVPRVDGVLEEGCEVPWGDEIDHKVLVCAAGVGPFVEVDFFHRPTRTLIVTDAVIFVPQAAPEVISANNSEALLISAADTTLDDPENGTIGKTPLDDSVANRRRGWSIMALRVSFLTPVEGVERTFNKLARRLIVSPLVEILVFSKALPSVRAWCDAIVEDWDFKRIIPAHYDAPVMAGPAEFRRAFDFAYEGEHGGARAGGAGAGVGGLLAGLGALVGGGQRSLPPADLDEEKKTLRDINDALVKSGVAKEEA